MSTLQFPTSIVLEGNERFLDELAQRLNANPAEMIRLAVRAVERAAKGTFHPDTLVQLLKTQGDEHTLRTFGRIGVSLRSQEVTALTGLSKSGLHKAKDQNRLMAYRLPGQSIDLFPLLQFDGKVVRDWVPTILKHTGNGAGALQFLTARRTSLEGSSYAEKLVSGFAPELIEQMKTQAEKIGEAGA